MTPTDLLRLRLENQALTRQRFTRPEQTVSWFGAMQSQDYLGSLWAVGQRTRAATAAAVEQAERRRAIVRTWPLRGTLHFVAADDVRWITGLLAPRVMARNAARLKKEVDVDGRVLDRSTEVVMRALAGGRRLNRQQLYEALEARKIRTGGSRGLHILIWLALRGTLCHAGRLGKQQSFALLDEWIPRSRLIDGEEAYVELALRYFRSRGPATRRDFMWWAGITAKIAVEAIEGAKHQLARACIDGVDYWWQERRPRESGSALRGPQVRLLPAFDEYTVAYHDRSRMTSGAASKMSLLAPSVLIDGRVVGRWSRTLTAATCITTTLNRPLTPAEKKRLSEAVRRYGDFIGSDAVLVG
jgi:hypothetical protein